MYLDMAVLQQPQFYLGAAAEKFDEVGELTDQETIELIGKYWEAFEEWIERCS